QELMWGITGLGKRLQGVTREFKGASLLVDGRTIEGKSEKGATGRSWGLVRASERKSLGLTVKDASKGKLWAVLSSEGVREKSNWKLGGEGLKLTRSYRTLTGETIDLAGGSVHLADLAVVEVTIANTSGNPIRN